MAITQIIVYDYLNNPISANKPVTASPRPANSRTQSASPSIITTQGSIQPSTNPEKYWQGDDLQDQWIQIDLGSDMPIKLIDYIGVFGTDYPNRNKNVKIELLTSYGLPIYSYNLPKGDNVQTIEVPRTLPSEPVRRITIGQSQCLSTKVDSSDSEYLALSQLVVVDNQGRNVAPGKTIWASLQTYAGFGSPSKTIDGNQPLTPRSDITQVAQLVANGVRNGGFILDLGAELPISKIVYVGRAEGTTGGQLPPQHNERNKCIPIKVYNNNIGGNEPTSHVGKTPAVSFQTNSTAPVQVFNLVPSNTPVMGGYRRAYGRVSSVLMRKQRASIKHRMTSKRKQRKAGKSRRRRTGRR